MQTCQLPLAVWRKPPRRKSEVTIMAYSLVWLRQVLLDAGLRVSEQPGWIDRGHGDAGPTKGVICHHTAGPANGNMPSLGVVTNGRPDLAGPLAQLGIGRDGTYYLVAAGKCYHAGAGSWRGVTTGNTSFIGIEAENTGLPGDPWPNVQMVAYQRGVAAILKHIGADVGMCCGHKEYALPKGRKDDPSFNMDEFRRGVADIMAGAASPPAPVAANAGQATLKRDDSGAAVLDLQQHLNVPASGKFDGPTEAAVRKFQSEHGMQPDGIVGPKTWSVLGGLALDTGNVDAISALAAASSIATYPWRNRGLAPIGYTKGMAVMFARMYCKLKANDAAAIEMSKAADSDPGKELIVTLW